MRVLPDLTNDEQKKVEAVEGQRQNGIAIRVQTEPQNAIGSEAPSRAEERSEIEIQTPTAEQPHFDSAKQNTSQPPSHQHQLALNADTMREFLQFLSARRPGVIEIIAQDIKRDIRSFERFDRIEPAVQWACKMNRVEGMNIYFRPGTVTKTGPGWTEDKDIASTPGIWADCDTVEAASKVLSLQHVSVRILTGRHPHPRRQVYILTAQPLPPDQARALNQRLAQAIGGDSQVVNPSRMMRLPGSIAWPVKLGRVAEMTEIEAISPEEPVALDALDAALPPLEGPEQKGNGTAGNELPDTIDGLIEYIRSRAGKWHDPVLRLVAKLVSRGRSDTEILTLAPALTWPGYRVEDTEADIRKMIAGARKKGFGANVQPEPVEFEPIEGEPAAQAGAASTVPANVWDPWEDAPAPEWPMGILSPQIEDTLSQISQRDGVDLGVLGTSVLGAASAGAPKNARFAPYLGGGWKVPPIVWCMLVGESGLRKTLLHEVAFAPIWALQRTTLSLYKLEVAQWEEAAKPSAATSPSRHSASSPATIPPRLCRRSWANRHVARRWGRTSWPGFSISPATAGQPTITPALSSCRLTMTSRTRCTGSSAATSMSNTRGLRCSAASSRTSSLCSPASRATACCSASCIRVKTTAVSQSGPVQGLERVHRAIERICGLHGLFYSGEAEGEALIRAREADGKQFAGITDYGPGWGGFCLKLHGTHARLALLLHLLEEPGDGNYPRCDRPACGQAHPLPAATRPCLLQLDPERTGRSPTRHRRLLLTKKPDSNTPERIVASQLAQAVHGCRSLGSKGIAEVLDQFVTGGWLVPETNYPNNRAWKFNPGIRSAFATRIQEERERRKKIREAVQQIGKSVS
jgi:hypothetical protein